MDNFQAEDNESNQDKIVRVGYIYHPKNLKMRFFTPFFKDEVWDIFVKTIAI